MARSRQRATKDCGIPWQVCEGFDSTSAREGITLVVWGKWLKQTTTRVDPRVVTHYTWGSLNFGKTNIVSHFILNCYICLSLDLLGFWSLGCREYSFHLLRTPCTFGSKLEPRRRKFLEELHLSVNTRPSGIAYRSLQYCIPEPPGLQGPAVTL
jgi:hypothetical protein